MSEEIKDLKLFLNDAKYKTKIRLIRIKVKDVLKGLSNNFLRNLSNFLLLSTMFLIHSKYYLRFATSYLNYFILRKEL